MWYNCKCKRLHFANIHRRIFMKRICLIFLSLVMLLGVFSGCNSEKEPVSLDGTVSTVGEGETDYYSKVPIIDMQKADFNMLINGHSWAIVDMCSEGFNSEIINDAIYKRMVLCNERLNVNLLQEVRFEADLKTIASPSIMSGDCPYKLLITSPKTAISMYNDTTAIDQNTISTIDFSNPWWEETIIDDINVSDKKYITYNQSNMVVYCSSYLFAFNQHMIEDNDMESPYDMVKNDTWTWENVYKMMVQVSTDTNGDGASKPANGEIVGLSSHVNHCVNLILSSGATICEKDANGNPTMGNDVNARYVDAFGAFMKYFVKNNYTAVADTSPDDFAGYTPDASGFTNFSYFKENKALFMTTSTYEVSLLRESEVIYGIVVPPKMDEKQESYITPVYSGSDGFIVPNSMSKEEYDEIGIVMDTLGLYSYNNLIDLHIGTVLHYRVALDPTAIEMINLAYDSKRIDIALANNFGGCTDTVTFAMRGKDDGGLRLVRNYIGKIKNDIKKAIAGPTQN